VGNFGDGTINAFDPTGKFLGQVTDSSKNVIVNPGLWDMVFGAGGTGDPNTLYFTAGGANQTSGLFATLLPATSATNPDFSLALSSQSATLASGQSTKVTISSSAVGGFNSPISLSCTNPPAGVTCSFSQATITPGSSTASSMLTISVAATTPPSGYATSGMMGWLPLSGIGAFGMFFVTDTRRKQITKAFRHGLGAGILGLLILGTLLTLGCGGSSNSKTTPVANTVTVMVTGTSGSLSHSTPFTLTIN
jgi:hypothetical protein